MRVRGRFWRVWSWCAIVVVLPLFLQLEDSSAGEAETAYFRVHQAFLHGYLERSQQQAAFGFHRFRDSNPRIASKFIVQEAEAMVWRGGYEDALALLANHRPDASDRDQIVRRLATESVALTDLQQISAAEQTIDRAAQICSESQDEACGAIPRARGLVAMARGQFGEAQALFLESLRFAQVRGDRWLETTAFLNLSAVALQDDHLDEAVRWAEEARRNAIVLGGVDLAQRAAGNLGWAYFGLGDSERALVLFHEAEKQATDLGDTLFRIKWLKTSAYVYRDYGNLAEAGKALREALDLATTIDSKQDVVDTLEDLSHISVEDGDLAAADGYIDRVLPLVTANRNGLDIAYVRLAQGKLAAARRQEAQAEALFRAVESDPASQVSMRFGAEHELAKLMETEGETAAASAAYRAALATFEGARDALKDDDSKLPFLANATRIYDDYIHFLVAQGKTQEALLVADQSRARTLAQGLGQSEPVTAFRPETFSPQAVARKADATLLFYWLGERESYLWAVTPERTVLSPLPPERAIAPLLDGYRKALLGSDDPLLATPPVGQELYTMLVGPAASLIRPNGNVMVLTDGPLSLLNFETLIVPEATSGASTRAAHYWIEDATLSSAPSLAMLAAAKPVREPDGGAGAKLLLIGDAVSPSADYPELPFASLEMQRVRQHFAAGNEVVFSRREATPAEYLDSDPGRFAYIHFVSHGVASRTDPLDSAIILSNDSGSAETQNSFKLYAREVMRHPIDARLVTISACYGSGTRAYAGEGLVGLSWAFLRAGAHSAIGALWEVSDNSTPRLMDALYRGLANGLPPAEALRQAKLALLHSNNSFRKPFYWAPFQIYTRM